MQVSIGDYNICDGTLSGGVAVSDLRHSVERTFDVVLPLVAADAVRPSPILFDRLTSKMEFTFTVKVCHGTLVISEAFILILEFILPRTGTIKLITNDGTTLNMANGRVLGFQLENYIGSTTFHSYHIIGSGPFTLTGPSASLTRTIITEQGSPILTEEGGTIETET